MTLQTERQILSPPSTPSKSLNDGGGLFSSSKILHPQHTFMTQRSSRSSLLSSPIMQQQQQQYHNNLRDNFTDSTKFSVASGGTSGVPCPCEQGDDERSSDSTSFRRRACCSQSQSKKAGSTRKLKITGLFDRCKQLSSPFRRRKALSETQLRKRLRKFAERGDWGAVRKLIDGYEFSDRSEQNESKQQQQQQTAALRDSLVIENPLPQGRRPSYGSRNGERLSFTGKESTAAAAVIQSALLEESSASSLDYDTPEMGENVLHDICKSRPPLDVLETLLLALRHRRGCTAATDDMGRTPLHLAADTGASPEIIRALVRSDPYIASMGDADRRSPLHLAVKYLADHQTHHSTIKNTSQEKLTISPQDVLERTHQVVGILKDAMLTYPGNIGFKDEDASGYSPLDYAIDVNVTKNELIQSLIRRKEPTKSRRFSRHLRGRPIRRLTTHTSISDDQDIEILESLEQDEIEARRHRIQQKKHCQKKEVINDALFDVFGIQASARASAEAAGFSPTSSNGNNIMNSQTTLSDIEGLQLHDFAFIQRSGGKKWTYAIIAAKDEDSILFVVDKIGSSKIITRKHWVGRVRLVNNTSSIVDTKKADGSNRVNGEASSTSNYSSRNSSVTSSYDYYAPPRQEQEPSRQRANINRNTAAPSSYSPPRFKKSSSPSYVTIHQSSTLPFMAESLPHPPFEYDGSSISHRTTPLSLIVAGRRNNSSDPHQYTRGGNNERPNRGPSSSEMMDLVSRNDDLIRQVLGSDDNQQSYNHQGLIVPPSSEEFARNQQPSELTSSSANSIGVLSLFD